MATPTPPDATTTTGPSPPTNPFDDSHGHARMVLRFAPPSSYSRILEEAGYLNLLDFMALNGLSRDSDEDVVRGTELLRELIMNDERRLGLAEERFFAQEDVTDEMVGQLMGREEQGFFAMYGIAPWEFRAQERLLRRLEDLDCRRELGGNGEGVVGVVEAQGGGGYGLGESLAGGSEAYGNTYGFWSWENEVQDEMMGGMEDEEEGGGGSGSGDLDYENFNSYLGVWGELISLARRIVV
ncbi:hypothetical protein DSL72_001824 [Monilinia vaccinii-corymbosi]|uniref:Uncharacterized protein n=1 Tax=Monilinia vaccinii-corymbosi TaxID=61207 RepID=A0A8A3PAX1_9HELO|nr:hypothetical protein DSL72_001824 [Monilinia vaccinii-corymbosi]